MRDLPRKTLTALVLFALSQAILAADSVSVDELAKAVQNPIANLISVPFQNNTSYEFGPQEKLRMCLTYSPLFPCP